MENSNQFKERRIWYFTCKCGRKHCQSHKKKNAKDEVCAVCRRSKVPENQLSIFKEKNGEENN